MSDPADQPVRYIVATHPGAEADIEAMAQWIADAGAPLNAVRWAQRLRRFIESLDLFPTGHVMYAEGPPRPVFVVPFERRRLVFYEVFENPKIVRVLYVWHGHRMDRPNLERQYDPVSD